MGERAKAADARERALELLLRVEKGAYLDALLGPAVERLRDAREAGLLTRIAYGVETWRARLDWTLDRWSGNRLESFEPAVRAALRIGLFQIAFLDRVPDHAAVDTSVNLAKSRTRGGGKVVNAILRRVLREGEAPPPSEEDDLAAYLAIRWSHPRWLVERWLTERGRAGTESLLAANTEPGPSAFRVDPRHVSRDDVLVRLAERNITGVASPYAPGGVVVDGPVSAVADLDELHPQGIASQIVGRMLTSTLTPPQGARVLDLCAAPGGKAAFAAETSESSVVFASDRAPRGIRRVGRLVRGRQNLHALRADGTRPPFRSGSFDAALVDAPCSGLGTLRAHPEVRWRRAPEDIARLAALQQRLLRAAAPLVRTGGTLTYATCTLMAEENERIVEDFLATHRRWVRVDPRSGLGAASRFIGEDLALRTSPDHDGLDGFYAIVLRNASEGV